MTAPESWEPPPPPERPPVDPHVTDRRPRPMIERIGLAAIAGVMGTLFGGVAVAAFVSGEPFLAMMGAIGCLMTLWVGGLTLFRG